MIADRKTAPERSFDAPCDRNVPNRGKGRFRNAALGVGVAKFRCYVHCGYLGPRLAVGATHCGFHTLRSTETTVPRTMALSPSMTS